MNKIIVDLGLRNLMSSTCRNEDTSHFKWEEE